MKRNNMETVRSVERASRLVEALFIAPHGKRLAELSHEVGLHKTTVLRLLRTLVSLGIVRRDPQTDQYRFEPLRWIAMGHFMKESLQRSDLVQRALDSLVEKTNCSAMVIVPSFDKRHTIIAIFSEPDIPVRLRPTNVRLVPIHCSAAGKAILSRLPDKEVSRILAGPLEKMTDHTITDPESLRQEIELARKRGYATCIQGAVEDICGIGVPIVDTRDRAMGGLSIAILGKTITDAQIAEYVPLLQETRDQIVNLLYAHSQHPSEAQRGAEALISSQEKPDVPQNETKKEKNYRMV